MVNTFEEPFGDVYRHGVWKPFGIFNSVKVFAKRYVEVLSPLLHLMVSFNIIVLATISHIIC